VQVFDNLGIALELSGRYDEALRQFETAVRVDPTFADAHYNLATVLARAGSIDEAVAQCQTALSLNPDFAAARDALKKLQAFQQANNGPSQL
jgi:tetratricopeptide (TPR) repeat protein